MRDDKVHGLVLQDPYNMGKLAVETVVAYLRGQTVKTRIDTGCTVATAENMDNPDILRLLSPPIK
jgi:ribose transport system substrate-binding protein